MGRVPEEVWRKTRPEGGGLWAWEAKVLRAMLDRMEPMTAWEVAEAAGLARRTGENGMRIFRKWGWVDRVGRMGKGVGKQRAPYLYELTVVGSAKAGSEWVEVALAKARAKDAVPVRLGRGE